MVRIWNPKSWWNGTRETDESYENNLRKHADGIGKWLMETEEKEITKRLAIYSPKAFERLHDFIHKILKLTKSKTCPECNSLQIFTEDIYPPRNICDRCGCEWRGTKGVQNG